MAIVPLDSFFTTTPAIYQKVLSELDLTEYNGKKLTGYMYDDIECITIQTFCDFFNQKETTVRDSFRKIRNEYPVKDGIDYYKISQREIRCDYRGNKFAYLLTPYITFMLLGKLRKVEKKIYYHFVHDYIDRKMNEIKYINYRPKNVYSLPPMGSKHTTKNLDQVDTRGELIIANILYDLQIPYQLAPIYHEYKVVPDFLIKTEPHMIIEYWGVNEESQHYWKYQNNRKRKQRIYDDLGWRVFHIEHDEVNYDHKLRERICNYFGGN